MFKGCRHAWQNLVVHVPHASTFVPPAVREQFLLSDEDLAAEAQESADLWSDLLARDAWPEATRVQAAVSRIIVDVERYPEDEREPMAAVGRGMIYTHCHNCTQRWLGKSGQGC